MGFGFFVLAFSLARSEDIDSNRWLATAGHGVVVSNEIEYIDLTKFLDRYGLASAWIEPEKRLRFSSAWTVIEFEVDSREIVYNGLRVFLGEGVMMREGRVLLSRIDAEKLLGPLLKPATFAGTIRPIKKIVIDPGHGGKDGGTTNTKLKILEKTVSLDVSKRLGEILRAQGFEVSFTRTEDVYLTLAERAEFSRAAQADLFISVHFNAAGKSTVTGVETYAMTPQFQRSTSSAKSDASDRVFEPGNAYDAWNSILGFSMHRALLQKLKPSDRGLKQARFAVLRLAECPSVLVEVGYLSNPEEARKIATESYRAQIAEGLANGITAYVNQIAALQSRP